MTTAKGAARPKPLAERVVGPDRSPDLAVAAAEDSADVNRRFFSAYVTSLPGADRLRVLDFGCGGGAVVRMLRAAGVDCYGADTFYDGAEYRGELFEQLLDAGIVRAIGADGVLPFEDAFFDLVISDQVFEHVEDLEGVLDQLDRVLRPGGRMYHHFPSREVLREGHIHIPLAHRLRPGRFRTAYTLVLRAAGFGDWKEGRTRREWVDWRLGWIDRYCVYRPYRELRASFDRRYVVRHVEIEYCRFRARDRPVLARALAARSFRAPAERLFRRLAFMAVELTPLAPSDVPGRPGAAPTDPPSNRAQRRGQSTS